tara:strand:- start:3724 stop:4470 length:747 start_codon:yes stop_codon:yes gene_type:complete
MKNFLKFIDSKIFNNFFKKTYQKLLIQKVDKFLKSYEFYENFSNLKNDELSLLCEEYGSDKGGRIDNNISRRKPHFYSSFYYEKFNKNRDKISLIFECGIGTNNKNFVSNLGEFGVPGASLKVWKIFFRNAKIIGADIDKNVLFNDDRIQTFYVDQKKNDSTIRMWNMIKDDNFDIIIDDGEHSYEAALSLFYNSFKKLKTGGVYIIEDVHVAYLIDLAKTLKKYKPKIISSNRKFNIDDYLFLITKD